MNKMKKIVIATAAVYPQCETAGGCNGPCGEKPVDTVNTSQEPVVLLPDGSAFGVMSFPLPESHWLYAERQYREGEYEPIELGKPILTRELKSAVVSAVRYAIRAATNCGKEMDFDPDALVLNAVYALCGPYTAPVDAVNTSQKRVDETAKRGHEPYDQTALELCEKCGWKAIIPDEGCLVCARNNQKPVAWENSAEWESLAWYLCAEEHGEEACDELLYDGGPVPEPWGERWLKYEEEAKRMIALVRRHTRPVDTVNTSQERVDETAKRGHEPVAWWVTLPGGEIDWSDEPIKYKEDRPLETLRDGCDYAPLYTAPPKREWSGLSVSKAEELLGEFENDPYEMLFALDKYLREKNT